jgi:hypothetical protein
MRGRRLLGLRSALTVAAVVSIGSIVWSSQLRGQASPRVARSDAQAVVNRAPVPKGTVNGSNPQNKSVLDAAKTKSHPERLSPMVKASPFDRDAFFKNPKAYLDVCEPGRVWQASREANAPVLRPESAAIVLIHPLGSVELAVLGAPNAPVTFTSVDLGQFSNGLTSITVQADDAGRASTVFTASEGTTAGVNILVGSPLASGQAKFHIEVVPQ